VLPEKGRAVYPVWAVLATVAAFGGGRVLGCRSGEPLAVEALLLRGEGALVMLVANLSGRRQRTRVRGVELELAPYEVARREFAVEGEAR